MNGNTMKAVIVAAGTGSRMQQDKKPKTLMPFGTETILSTIIKNCIKAGISEFVIVTGYEAVQIHEYASVLQKSLNISISFAQNNEWTRGNGISVLAAAPFVGTQPFILSMSDHIVSSSAIERIARFTSEKNLLLVDPNINEVFDIDDATKVQVEGSSIREIGKEISIYNAIDCGIFRLTNRFFDSMRNSLHYGRESISAAITGLIAFNDMDAVFMRENEYWSDIDTPAAYDDAIKNFSIEA
jgi:choline kinase